MMWVCTFKEMRGRVIHMKGAPSQGEEVNRPNLDGSPTGTRMVNRIKMRKTHPMQNRHLRSAVPSPSSASQQATRRSGHVRVLGTVQRGQFFLKKKSFFWGGRDRFKLTRHFQALPLTQASNDPTKAEKKPPRSRACE